MRGSPLLRYILRRLLQIVPVVLGVVVLNFLLLQLAPGDLATVLAGEAGGAPKEYIDQLRQRFGQDQPVLIQLFNYVRNLLLLDLGYSFRQSAPVLDLLLDRLWPTLLLMGATLVLSLGCGIVMGLLAALWVRTWKDHVVSVAAIIFYATPLFWVGLMLILVFSIYLDWFPTSGMEDVVAFYEGWDRVVDIAHHLVLPSITLSLFYLALYARLMRASMLEQRGLEYVTTARAKGLTERQITTRHVLRNALLPVVTMAGVQVGSLLGGSVIVESVFAWPGLGQLAYQSLFARDFNLLLGIFFMSACLVVVVNLVVDVIYVVLDPRIRFG
jgi:peptide/nickel transport system permease protein